MDITGSVALVTGSNRGIGRHFVEQLLERGASKVYATARRPDLVDVPGVEVLALDITDPASVAAAAAAAGDVTLLIDNAGVSSSGSLLTDDLADARRAVDTHLWGTLDMVRAFAPVIERNGGGRHRQRPLRALLVLGAGRGWVRHREGRRVEHDQRRPARARRPGESPCRASTSARPTPT
ncbi:SDR family NAD(P)-dependent oxidoreductase [Curtobacterium sp. MCPF17_052]|uniref:SDR family NAD(P)-dependent oxidoreductase n=1 Tax=Curtobacterium sp. MCPF17_052 TaxID=2175655 RepID=UPI003463B4BC